MWVGFGFGFWLGAVGRGEGMKEDASKGIDNDISIDKALMGYPGHGGLIYFLLEGYL